MNQSISVREWHQMALEGSAPPVRILLNGGSMQPLIRMNRDYVTIVQPDEDLQVGDIVLFYEPYTDRYIVHRIWDMDNNRIMTWGDYLPRPDDWMPIEAIWGKVVLIERGRKQIQPDPKKGIIWATIWHRGGKWCRLYIRYKNGIIRRINKLKARGTQ